MWFRAVRGITFFLDAVLHGSRKKINFVRKTMQMSGNIYIYRTARGATRWAWKFPRMDVARFFLPKHRETHPTVFSTPASYCERAIEALPDIVFYLFNSFSLCASFLFFC